MTEYTLHCFYESGNAYKAALMLALNQADWQPQGADFFDGVTRRPEWREENNVMGEIPILVHHRKDGDVRVTQSGAILAYLSRRFGTFGAADADEEIELMRWLLFDSQKVSGYAGPLRFLRIFARTGETAVTEFLHGRFANALGILNAQLGDREWLVKDRCTIADLACCGYLYWPDEIGISYEDYPRIQPWLERIRALPGWKHPVDLMPRAFRG